MAQTILLFTYVPTEAPTIFATINNYLNNAILRKHIDKLGEGKTVVCFASLIDPMGTFKIVVFNDVNFTAGRIYIYFDWIIKYNYFVVDLTVTPNNNVTVIESIKLKINGQSNDDVRIDEKNFNKKTPFSIANTVVGFKQGNVKHNNNQAVKKFLGDYLQGMEAIKHGYIYYSGDKPATAMYDWMKLIFLLRNIHI